MDDDELTPFYTQQVPERSADNHAIDQLIHNRPRILKVKLAVLATQIQERLHVRANNLRQVNVELLEAGTHLIPFENVATRSPPLDESVRRFWVERKAALLAEIRTQDVECWRDVAQAMTEFLSGWEATEQSTVRANFLREQADEERR